MYSLMERKANKKVDPSLAEHYLTFNKYIAQRPIRQAHVQELAEKMTNGMFRHGNIAFGVTDEVYMMDGQHVCNAIMMSQTAVPCVIEKYKCEDENDLATLFRQFEILKRSQTDMIRAKHHAMNITLWPLWISQIIVTAAAMERKYGIFWYESRLTGGTGQTVGGVSSRIHHSNKITTDDKIEFLGKYMTQAEYFYHLVCDPENGHADRMKVRHIARAIVVFMILKTLEVNKNDSDVFWNRVIFGEKLTMSRPEYKLREFLKSNIHEKGKKNYSDPVNNHEIAYKIALAWNAFRKNTRTNLAYRSSLSIPKLM